ncbi:DNA polymerase beta [Brachionus plicatilis]|uniref:DNA polymerase n=1 Tax=Brachionus plicatilis TaxID=10195 RepID=A0A3M7PH55_BRAPC|nr:DNA polymerase beta [Brachionus plicatilis]
MASETKKSKSDNKDTNKEIANMLNELAEYEKNNKQRHKYNAYRKAAQSVLASSNQIKSASEAKKLNGVGQKIAEKIGQYLETGKMEKLEKIKTNFNANVIKELTRVTGIGPTHAHKLFDEGIRSIEDLKQNQDKLNHHQKIGLKYVDDFEKRIPREEMIRLKDLIVQQVEALDKDYLASVCGSFRRGLESSGDIDILLTHPNFVSSSHVKENKKSVLESIKEKSLNTDPKDLLKKVIDKLIKIDFITDTLAYGDTKFMGVCSLDKKAAFRRIDIRLIPNDQFYCGVLYFTGSDTFNRNMRKIALEKGYTLNEYSLRKINASGRIPGKAEIVNSEKEIFDFLGMKYLKPEERN